MRGPHQLHDLCREWQPMVGRPAERECTFKGSEYSRASRICCSSAQRWLSLCSSVGTAHCWKSSPHSPIPTSCSWLASTTRLASTHLVEHVPRQDGATRYRVQPDAWSHDRWVGLCQPQHCLGRRAVLAHGHDSCRPCLLRTLQHLIQIGLELAVVQMGMAVDQTLDPSGACIKLHPFTSTVMALALR